MTRSHIGAIEDFSEGEGQKVEVDGIEIAVFNLEGELWHSEPMYTQTITAASRWQ